MIDGEILGDLDRRVGHVSDTHHCGLRLSIDEISKVIEVVSNGRIASIVDHHKKLKCGVVVTGRDELLHFQHVLALLHLNVFGPEHGNLVGIIESLGGDHQVDLDRVWGSLPLRMYNPHPQCQCAASRNDRDGNPVALHLDLLESRASRIASVGQTAELSVLPGLAGGKPRLYVSSGCGKRWETKMLPAKASRMATTSSLAILDF